MFGSKKADAQNKIKLVVVGNGMVVTKFLENLVESHKANSFEIVVYGEENIPAYDRIHLTEQIGKEDVGEILLRPSEWYKKNGINLILNETVIEINRDEKFLKSN